MTPIPTQEERGYRYCGSAVIELREHYAMRTVLR